MLRWLGGTCDPCDTARTCPTVVDDGDDVVVIGYELDEETRRQLSIPAGEIGARIPKTVFRQGAARLDQLEGARDT
jgi:hypothetical protein